MKPISFFNLYYYLLQPVWHGYLACGLITVAVASEGSSSGSSTETVMSSLWSLASWLGGQLSPHFSNKLRGNFNRWIYWLPQTEYQKHIYRQTYKYFIYEPYKFLKLIIEFNPRKFNNNLMGFESVQLEPPPFHPRGGFPKPSASGSGRMRRDLPQNHG